MTRGRKPKPVAVKKLAGNPGHRPLNEDGVPQPPVPDHTPYVPRYLNEDGKHEWRRVVKVLRDLGLYTVLDRTALAMYCQVYGRWIHAERELLRKGEVLESSKGNLYQNPWLHVANKAWEQMRKVLAEFGLTPSSRSRMQIAHGEPEPTLADVLFGMVHDDDD